MKQRTIAILLTVLILSGCDNLLDVEADNVFSGNIYTSDQNFEDLLNGAYLNLGGIYDGIDGGELFGGDFQLIGTLLSREKDRLFFWRSSEAPDYQDFMDKEILDINARVEANWRRAYETLNLVNGILQNIALVQDAALQTRIQGEALAIRGMIYFELVRLWGPQYSSSTLNAPAIPILLEPITDITEFTNVTRNTVAEVYDRAIRDLQDAIPLLSDSSIDLNRINVYVCEAVLARIAMQQGDYDEAVTRANNVFQGPFTLAATPMVAFNNLTRSGEEVFLIQQNQITSTGGIATRTGLVAHLASLPGVGFAAMNVNFPLLGSSGTSNSPDFSSADQRFVLQSDLAQSSTVNDINVETAFYNDPVNTTTVSPAKYYRTDAVIPVIRLAEIHLIRSEALLETQGVSAALPDLNAIRSRAGLSALSNTLTEFQIFDSLSLERNRELIFEGQYIHDLKRWFAFGRRTNNDQDDFIIQRLSATRFLEPDDESLILPIPQAECDASPQLCN
ncbi:MAG: RagB/SusD family nutrient uptake outer membrane protein [Bacteroidota bacterium]